MRLLNPLTMCFVHSSRSTLGDAAQNKESPIKAITGEKSRLNSLSGLFFHRWGPIVARLITWISLTLIKISGLSLIVNRRQEEPSP